MLKKYGSIQTLFDHYEQAGMLALLWRGSNANNTASESKSSFQLDRKRGADGHANGVTFESTPDPNALAALVNKIQLMQMDATIRSLGSRLHLNLLPFCVPKSVYVGMWGCECVGNQQLPHSQTH